MLKTSLKFISTNIDKLFLAIYNQGHQIKPNIWQKVILPPKNGCVVNTFIINKTLNALILRLDDENSIRLHKGQILIHLLM